MKFKKIFLIAAAALTFTSGAADQRSSFVAAALKPWIDSGELPGAISVLSQGDRQDVACLGWADVEHRIPMALDRTFMQCSQTKGFCGVTVAILVEEGRLSTPPMNS